MPLIENTVRDLPGGISPQARLSPFMLAHWPPHTAAVLHPQSSAKTPPLLRSVWQRGLRASPEPYCITPFLPPALWASLSGILSCLPLFHPPCQSQRKQPEPSDLIPWLQCFLLFLASGSSFLKILVLLIISATRHST